MVYLIVGVPKAKELVFTGRTIDGEEALSCGFFSLFFFIFFHFVSFCLWKGLVNYHVPNDEQAEEGANTAAFEKCLDICRLIGDNVCSFSFFPFSLFSMCYISCLSI